MKSLQISPEEFRRVAERVTQIATDYLTTLDSLPTFPLTSGAETERLFHTPLPELGIGANALTALSDVLGHSRPPSPRFFGYVLGSGEPVAAVADLLASVLNQNLTAWRSGPAAATIERTVVKWLAQAVGCTGFEGSLTGGGSSANLMGLAMAREAKVPANEKGIVSGKTAVIYASEEIHMSMPKAIALLGIGRQNLRLIPVDHAFRMIPSELDAAIQEDKRAGKHPIAVIASAGTVNTGAIDPLAQVTAVARAHDLWLHIDGAYGALASIAAPGKFAGLNLADSLSLDAHKWLYQPLDCGCLLFRDVQHARTTFAYSGDYAKVLSTDPVESFAFFEESMELSRRFRALKLWLSLRYHGLQTFRAAIQKDLDLAQRLARNVEAHPQLELSAPVELSAVCFRYKAEDTSGEERDRRNRAILKRVIERGRVFISNATLRGKFCLRACIVNHRATEADVDSVIPEVLGAAKDLGF
jgi:glutamate/tyrosine decarboxylase-like PLP-dependent enzyme